MLVGTGRGSHFPTMTPILTEGFTEAILHSAENVLTRTITSNVFLLTNGVPFLSININEIAHLWHHVSRQMYDLFRTTVQQYDLPSMAYPMLRQIQKEPGITISQLSRRLGTAKSHISNLADQLMRENFIEKRTDPTDQRLLRLYVTPTALEGLDGMRHRANQLWDAVLEELPEGGAEELLHFLRSFHAALMRVNNKINAAESPLSSAEGS